MIFSLQRISVWCLELNIIAQTRVETQRNESEQPMKLLQGEAVNVRSSMLFRISWCYGRKGIPQKLLVPITVIT